MNFVLFFFILIRNVIIKLFYIKIIKLQQACLPRPENMNANFLLSKFI